MGSRLVTLAIVELVGLVVLMVVSMGLLCWGIDGMLPPAAPTRKKRRKRQTCPAQIVNGRKK